jgi:hypothetical protein
VHRFLHGLLFDQADLNTLSFSPDKARLVTPEIGPTSKNTRAGKSARLARSLFLLPAFLLPFAGCGLLVHGTSQDIVCVSSPAGAIVKTGNGKWCTTPCTLTLNRKKAETITVEKDGYEPVTLRVRSLLLKSSAGQVLLPGGLICWAIDIASGGAYRLSPSWVDIDLISTGDEAGTEGPGEGPEN